MLLLGSFCFFHKVNKILEVVHKLVFYIHVCTIKQMFLESDKKVKLKRLTGFRLYKMMLEKKLMNSRKAGER